MTAGTEYAFVLLEGDDWRLRDGESWEWDVVELDGTEQLLGHKKLEGAVRRVVRTTDGKIVALAK